MVSSSAEYSIASLTIAVVLLIVGALQVCLHVWRSVRRHKVIGAVHQAKRCTCLGILKSSCNIPDETLHLVLREVEGMRQKHFVSALSMFSTLGYFSLLWVIWKTFLGEERFLTQAQDAAFTTAIVLATAAHNFPHRVHGHCLDVVFALVMLCMCVFLTLGNPSNEMASYLSTMSAMPRLAMSVAHGKFWLVAPCNLACVCCVVLRYWPWTDAVGTSGLKQQEVLFAVCAVWGSILADKARWEYAHEMIKNKMLLGANSATGALLNLMCDVVVEMDANCKLVREAPKLEAMLALHSTRGATLQQYMPNEVDRSRFQDVLSADDLQGDVSLSYEPGALHSTLRDSWGNHISVEMFYIQFRGPDLCLRSFVGIREFADQKVSDLPSFPQRQKDGKQKQKPDTDRGTEQGDSCSDARTAPDVHQRGHSSHQAAPGQLRGTPPVVAEPLSLSARWDEQSLASSRSSGSVVSDVLLNPSLLGTWDLAKDLTLIDTISRWNVHVSKKDCCPLHCATMEASTSLKRLMRKGCKAGFQLSGNRQCRQCGLMEDGGECCLKECEKHGRCKACLSADFVETKPSL
mmetsp:Transcript_87261/g.281920  ORF Transcript_87261/g.281920 Transcript_87261/m.281920 type:complete len:575 (+) Transcript_87261:66-1790(+)